MKDKIECYLDWKASYTTKAPSTYRLHLERFNTFVGHKPLAMVQLSDVIAFQQLLRTRYAMSNVAYATIILKNFFDFYRRQGIGCIDPWLIKKPKYICRPHYALSPDDFQRMDECLRDDYTFEELEKKLAINLLWDCGMRVSELCDLEISQIDRDKTMTTVVTKKNNQLRWIMWSQKTHNLLIKYLGVRLCLNQTNPLFIASHNGRREGITERTIQRWMKEICDKASIKKKISPHSFRHGKAHQILDKGGNPKHVQAILGHSENNPISAFAYLRLNTTEFQKIAAQFL